MKKKKQKLSDLWHLNFVLTRKFYQIISRSVVQRQTLPVKKTPTERVSVKVGQRQDVNFLFSGRKGMTDNSKCGAQTHRQTCTNMYICTQSHRVR